LARLEESLGSKPSSEDLIRLERELRDLKSHAEDAGPATLPADLATKLAGLEERLSETESSSRLEDADTRLGALETRLGALGEPAEISRRLTLLEMNPSPADPRLEDVLNRLGALESKPFETLSDTRIHELRDSVADLHAELETVSKERLPLLTELPERLNLLEARVRDAATSGSPDPAGQELLSSLEHQVRSLSEKVEGLGNSPAEPALDPRVSELLARIEWVERNGSSASTMSDVDLEAIKRRLDVMEGAIAAGPSSDAVPSGLQTELAARLNAIEHALGNLEEGSAAGAAAGATAELEAALKRETNRWNQWARNTIQEIAELRDSVEGGGHSGASGTGIDAESVEALAVQITSGLNNSEVKALRGQMYFVYLSIGVLWAILLYVLFAQ
jgi:chromosome segregation ATPase